MDGYQSNPYLTESLSSAPSVDKSAKDCFDPDDTKII